MKRGHGLLSRMMAATGAASVRAVPRTAITEASSHGDVRMGQPSLRPKTVS
jgi:hypothetical protein